MLSADGISDRDGRVAALAIGGADMFVVRVSIIAVATPSSIAELASIAIGVAVLEVTTDCFDAAGLAKLIKVLWADIPASATCDASITDFQRCTDCRSAVSRSA